MDENTMCHYYGNMNIIILVKSKTDEKVCREERGIDFIFHISVLSWIILPHLSVITRRNLKQIPNPDKDRITFILTGRVE